jgi:exodeoxyribonuclease VII large subunit
VSDLRPHLNERRQELDDLSRRAGEALRQQLRARRATLERLDRALARAHPRARLADDRARLHALSTRLGPALSRRRELAAHALRDRREALLTAQRRLLETRKLGFAGLAAKLHALSPLAILARGYSVVLREGQALTDAREATPGDVVTLRLHRGELDARVETVRDGED